MKMAFISMHPAPYRNSFISVLVNDPSLDVDVFILLSFDKGHDFWGLKKPAFDVHELEANKRSWVKTTWRLLRNFIFSRKYDFVMWPGWTYSCLLLPIFMSSILGLRYGFVADTVEQRDIGKLAFWIKRLVVRRAKMVFVPGNAAEKFFSETFGVDKKKIVKGAYSLDGAALEREIMSRRTNKEALRDRLGISNAAKMFLMVANMTPNRCYPITVRAFVEVAKLIENSVFVVVGKGVDLPVIEKIAEENNKVKVIPGCSFDEMLSLYATADIYVHGGKEPASTALVIGAISHLPIISSMAVGCSADVLVDGESGYEISDYLDQMNWADGFQRAMADQGNWHLKGDYARELSKQLDVDSVESRFLDVIVE